MRTAFVTLLAFAALSPLALGQNPSDGTFGPYLQSPTENGAVVCWRTATAGTSEVEYGTTQNYGQNVQQLASAQWHQVPVTGLAANTLYYYRAVTRANGQAIFSETGSFRTMPPRGAPLSFVHMAETHDDDEVTKFREEVAASGASFIVDASDQVDDGAVLNEWDHYFTIGEAIYRNTPVVNAVGNHSYVGTGLFKTGIFGNLNMFKQVNVNPGNEEWFTFRVGDVLFIYLNSTWYFDPFRLSTSQISWLKKTLADATDGNDDPVFKVAVFHTPPYSSGPWYRDYLEKIWAKNFFVKHLKAARTDLVLLGHDKFNEHSVVDGVHYVQVATGALSAKRIQAKNPGKVWLSAQTRGMTVVRVNGRRLDAQIVDNAGNVLHSFSIAK